MSSPILKDSQFKLVTEFVKPDTKRRITLGSIATAGAFNLYQNAAGQIVLDPVKVIPASEAWLYESPLALESVKQGLRESAEGKVTHLGSFAKHAA